MYKIYALPRAKRRTVVMLETADEEGVTVPTLFLDNGNENTTVFTEEYDCEDETPGTIQIVLNCGNAYTP